MSVLCILFIYIILYINIILFCNIILILQDQTKILLGALLVSQKMNSLGYR